MGGARRWAVTNVHHLTGLRESISYLQPDSARSAHPEIWSRNRPSKIFGQCALLNRPLGINPVFTARQWSLSPLALLFSFFNLLKYYGLIMDTLFLNSTYK
jgi:hypothetical protein